MKTRILLMAIAFMASGSLISAQSDVKTENTKTKKSCYVDANNNNVCDKHEDKTCTTGNGKGLMDGSGKGQAKAQGQQNGEGKKTGKHKNQKNAKGPNYVDANKDGVCDKSVK